jgi:putative ribosome biogenesis GTPase RsgA
MVDSYKTQNENKNNLDQLSKQLSTSLFENFSCELYREPSQISNMKFDSTFKLILIGNSGVGKSCIIKRIGSNTFSEDHEVTIGAEFTTIAAKVDQKSFLKM